MTSDDPSTFLDRSRVLHVQWSEEPETINDRASFGQHNLERDQHYQLKHDLLSNGGFEAPNAKTPMASLDEDSLWSKRVLLSLDGGGVRGLSTLYVLKRIMEEVGEYEREWNKHAKSSAYSPLFHNIHIGDTTPSQDSKTTGNWLPCHYFDYIGGTSTGGLIAIMLGRLRMSVDEAIEEYKELAKNVFEKPSSRLIRYLENYDSAARRQKLQDRFEELAKIHTKQDPSEAWSHFMSDPERCRTIVCSIKSARNNTLQAPFLFRSYYSRKTSQSITHTEKDPRNFEIWEVARAASAAPSFFKSVTLGNDLYYDGVVNLNNPSWELCNEFRLLAVDSREAIDVLLSIGGGNTRADKPKVRSRRSALLSNWTYPEYVQKKVRMESKRQVFSYYRLDAEGVHQSVRIDEWKPKETGKTTLGKIKAATEKYLKRDDIRSCCRKVAQELARKRILRSQTMRWESFATGARYKCPLPECSKRRETVFLHRNALMDHLRKEHNKAPPDTEHYKEIQTLLDKGRTHTGSSSELS
ncbi:MAG: hypothetical protein Q9214_001238 [Letrouitia sp. 1 TL-2023]